ERAFAAIFDSNITTILSGIVLFLFGAGPIRGFAVTLCAGLIVNMYTALVVTKLLFGLLTSKAKIETLKMMSLFRACNYDFVSKRKVAAIFSVALIVVTWAVMVFRGVKDPAKVFGVDFTGGTALEFSFRQKVPMERIRDALAAEGIASATIQYQREMDKTEETLLLVKVGTEPVRGESQGAIVKRVLSEKFPEAGFVLQAEDDVGPQVGRELKRRATWAVAFALGIMIVYLAFRFEMGFATGATVALFHDVLVTVGVYSLLGRQINLPIVAALLTIVGYSVNDTIVIFDRIREDLKLVRNKSFSEICNLSINQTLSRTVLTTLTTLLTVIMLLIFGGGVLYDFALALFVGMIAGTYSTIFIATPIVLAWHGGRRPELGLPGK
ncbi:MAG: protein translocase subunit SecF, partial [Kiritimatiellae bacterium]|nr:protein translocase subunit SecF [Kiritimatiellia bacterium]